MTITIRQLKYGLHPQQPILQIDHLVLAPGEPTALVGANGSGKTTLLRLLHGLIKPVTGEITGLPTGPTHRTAMVFQQTRLLRLSCRRQLMLAAWLSGQPLGRLGAIADHWLDRVGLTTAAGQQATTLSGGQQQRLAIGQALLSEPSLLLLDEPTASLDAEQTPKMEALFAAFQASGLPDQSKPMLIFTSHDSDQISRLARRQIRLSGGQVVSDERL